MRKKIDRYRAMPDEYHKDSDDYLGMDGFKNLQDMKRLGYEPGAPVRLWEWMSGSGRLSATARARAMSHLQPLDYRYGDNLGHWHHQMIALFTLLVFLWRCFGLHRPVLHGLPTRGNGSQKFDTNNANKKC